MRLPGVAIIIALGIFAIIASPVMADDGSFWVVGSAAKGCWVVEQNPVVDGEIEFSDGPYRSMDDAKLAMTTISICKK